MADERKPEATKPAAAKIIVAASGAASNAGPTGKMIEEAMAKATLAALAEGIQDPKIIRERKEAARRKLTKGF